MPIRVPAELVAMFKEGGAAKRQACGTLLNSIHEGLLGVTVNAPDYETLQVIQATKRLYRPFGKRLTSSEELELTRRFLKVTSCAFNGY